MMPKHSWRQLKDLENAIGMIILPLHGAMVADGYDESEGDLISRVRSIVEPEIPIGVELDLHCHLTQTMVEQSDLIAIYREYPHTDILQRAEALLNMTVDMALGKTRPVMAMHDCRMINLYPTALEPMRSIVNRLPEVEQGGKYHLRRYWSRLSLGRCC
ncbi:M81 family metallopeptidase [Endozoicomonas atrinae]|uniref:M81 family metallopeptidase n=1 Tax=Endozoicomonas atrinae TaxID=1333660 RepID=UPI000AF1DEE7|nr:M81 family metallopeptidase [Endozoicomonas atrinae]